MMMLQIWHFGFSHYSLTVDVTVYEIFYFIKMFLKFGVSLYAQKGVTSNGCLDEANWL